MAGIYIHVPFCRQACRYCDFYFTVSLKYREEYVAALLKEMEQRKEALSGEVFSTVYLGGGSPSVLTEGQLEKISTFLNNHYSIENNPELTIEANPDDLSSSYLKTLRNLGFNRLSVGIQSFREKDLELMRRSHSAIQAKECLERAGEEGFSNINMDLIYGIPNLDLNAWKDNLHIAMQQPVQHISAYHLTFEPGTVFYHWKARGKIKEAEEQLSVEQFKLLREISAKHYFEHYEISNFAKAGFRSKHNTSYWNGEKYIGFGPSAHSYDGTKRRWNKPSLKTYIEQVNNNEIYYESEILSPKDLYHDYLLTSLRTKEGSSLSTIENLYGKRVYALLADKAKKYIASRDLVLEEQTLKMTPAGWLRSDLIISDLMLPENYIISQQDTENRS